MSFLSAAAATSGLLLPAAAAAPPTGSHAETSTAGPQQTEAAALGAARSSGHRVEVLAERTETRQVFANPDGTFTSETSALPRWVHRGTGWVPVDTTLHRTADGGVAPAATAFEVHFSGGGSGPLARIAAGGRSVSMSWPGTLPAPELSGSTATYRNVLPGVDLRVTATATGFSEVLVVKNPAAAANPALATLKFGLHADGVSVGPDGSGGLVARDPAGRQVFRSAPPLMWDSAGTVGPAATLSAPRPGSRRAPMATRLGAGRLTVVPDRNLLTHAVFPLYIDPSWSGGKLAWAMVDKAFPNQEYWNPDHRPESGYYGSGVKRTFFRMDSNNVNGKHILSATFRITETYAWSCSARRVDLYLTGQISSATNWNHQPGFGALQDHVTAAHGYSSACPDAGLEFNVTSAITSAAAGGWSSTVFALRAHDETDVFGWKGYSKNPSLVVSYNTPPSKPSGIGTSPGMPCVFGGDIPVINAGTPESPLKLLATVFDPDKTKDSVRAEFELFRWDGTAASWVNVTSSLPGDGHTTYVSSSSKVARSVTVTFLTSDTFYAWNVRAFDGVDGSAWTDFCEFKIDTTNPGSPPVVTSTDYPANTPDEWHGGVGQTGSFTFSPGPGDPDVVAYRYALDDPNLATPATQVAASSPGAPVTVQITPTHFFLNTLFVFPVDQAGNVGANRAEYQFYVNPGADPVAHWTFDETTGTTAADGSGNNHPATLVGGASRTRGRVSGGLHTDGLTGYATTAGPVVRTDQSFSVSAWVRLSDPGDGSLPTHNVTAVGQDGAFNSGFYLGDRIIDNRVHWSFSMQTSDSETYTWAMTLSAEPPEVGVWTHLVGVYDQGARQIRLYVNGELAGQTSYTTPWNATGPVQIGRVEYRDRYTDYFSGDIDDVKIWNRALSDDPRTVSDPALTNEIAALAKQPPELLGAWTFDEGTGTSAADSSGLGHPATLASGATWATEGHDRFGSALSLDGTTGYAATDDLVVRTDHSFSVVAWVRLTDPGDGTLPAAARTAVSQDRDTGLSAFFLGYRWVNDAHNWSFAMRDTKPDGTTTFVMTSSDLVHAPQVGTWTQLVGVYDEQAQQIRLYVNAQLVDTLPFVGPRNSTGPVQIGRAQNAGAYTDYFPGDIDDVRIYTGVLTDRQVFNVFLGLPPV